MNINSAHEFANLSCGGPGSGRHPSGLTRHPESSALHPGHPAQGSTANNKHASFTKQGFKYIGTKSMGGRFIQHQYEHAGTGNRASFESVAPASQ